MLIDPAQAHNSLQRQIQLNNNNTEQLMCSECNCTFFRNVLMVRKASKLLIGSTQDQIIPIPVLRCDDCGTPLEETMPINE